jgi:HK97 gp10 family phage protein
MPADFSEVRSLAADLGKARAGVVPASQKVIVKTAHDIEGTGKEFSAVDTGTQRNSIGVDVGVLQAIIGPTTSYSPHQEYGTSRMPPHPFMNPAADRHSPPYYAALEQVVGQVLD